MVGAQAQRVVAEKYALGPLLGRGAVGEVYLAHHVVTGAEVALKLIPRRFMGSEQSLQRFHREVSIANRIGHPGMVAVHDAGLDPESDGYYLAMERLTGQSLGARAAEPDFDWEEGLEVVRAVLSPLAAAHQAGIVHRDLKPDNVFLHQNPRDSVRAVKLLDFGIARDQRALQSATLADVTLGTPSYMSPEQATSARDVTPAADVWSIGVMLYWLRAGRLPFEFDTVFNTLTAICTQPHPPLPIEVASDRGFAALVDRCLEKDASRRFPDAAAVLEALEAWMSGPTEDVIRAVPDRADTEARAFDAGAIQSLTWVEHQRRWPRLAAGVVLILLGLGAVWMLPLGDPPPEQARPLEAQGAPTQGAEPPRAPALPAEPAPAAEPELGTAAPEAPAPLQQPPRPEATPPIRRIRARPPPTPIATQEAPPVEAEPEVAPLPAPAETPVEPLAETPELEEATPVAPAPAPPVPPPIQDGPKPTPARAAPPPAPEPPPPPKPFVTF